jgi:predicted nucleic acid-binding protein
MDILVTDANIWIDVDVGGLTEAFCALSYQVVIPDALFRQELQEHHAEVLTSGAELRTVSGSNVLRTVKWQQDYQDASRLDLLALSLANQLNGILLSGDKALRQAAENEGVECHGTIWVGDRLLSENLVSRVELRDAYQAMKDGDRRLPWSLIEERIHEWGTPPLE